MLKGYQPGTLSWSFHKSMQVSQRFAPSIYHGWAHRLDAYLKSSLFHFLHFLFFLVLSYLIFSFPFLSYIIFLFFHILLFLSNSIVSIFNYSSESISHLSESMYEMASLRTIIICVWIIGFFLCDYILVLSISFFYVWCCVRVFSSLRTIIIRIWIIISFLCDYILVVSISFFYFGCSVRVFTYHLCLIVI